VKEALYASASEGHKCADCSIDQEACPTCYNVWWKKRHPNTELIDMRLKHIKDIEARFYSWVLSEPQEIDFAWLCKTLKEELCGK